MRSVVMAEALNPSYKPDVLSMKPHIHKKS